MPYRIVGIDVHKKMLAVVVADVEIDGDFHFDRQKVGTTPADLRGLADWLIEHDVEEVVMESTAQYWRPVWEALEQHWRPRRRARAGAPRLAGTLHLAQAQSNRGPGGRKRDFPDAERLVKRLVAQELTLSFVPDTEQRLWRTVMRRKYQITRNRVQLHNRLEALLEEAHIKVSSLVSDLLGTSARHMRQALAEGETDPAALTKLAAPRLRATPEQLCDAFQVCPTLHPVYRRLLKLTLEELRVIEDHLGQLDQQMADLLAVHHDAVQRLAEVPGLGVDSAQQIIAEVGATAATFPSPKHLASWMGACPGNEESAGVNYYYGVQRGPTSPGRTWLLDVSNVSVTPYTYHEDFTGGDAVLSRDNLKIGFRVHTVWRVDATQVPLFMERFSTTVTDSTLETDPDAVVKVAYHNFVREPLRTFARDEVQRRNGLEVKEALIPIGDSVLSRIRAYAQGSPFLIDSVVVGNVQYPDEVANAVSRKLAATQELERKDTEIEIERKERTKREVQAQGIANAMQIIRGQLSPMYIQHEAIEAQKAMVNSPNHTVVYIPVGPMGVPITGTFAATEPRGPSTPR